MSSDDRIESILASGPPETDAYSPPPFGEVARSRPLRQRGAFGLQRDRVIEGLVGVAAILAIAFVAFRPSAAGPPGASQVAQSGAGSATPGNLVSAPPPTIARVIDPSIKPVSFSNPTADEKRALELCNVGRFDFGADRIGGMGLVASARDVTKYVPLSGKEPELDSDQPVWVVAFKGEIELPRGRSGSAKDPVCVVIDGDPILYLPWGTIQSPDLTLDRANPQFALPPLLP